ncbi:hypothetical protein DER44DRAFT_746831 [Fusarium oxysporum]|nr:hypothetical protein DER44DRAFT_746831 [Fusarium oxysporum]
MHLSYFLLVFLNSTWVISAAIKGLSIFENDGSVPVINISSADFGNGNSNTGKRENISPKKLKLKYTRYAVTIDGRNMSNWQDFQTIGSIYITDPIPMKEARPGSQNQVEVILATGRYGIPPAPVATNGDLWYVTNSYLVGFFSQVYTFGGLKTIDFANEYFRMNQLTVRIDTSDPTLASKNKPASFKAKDQYYKPSSGGFVLDISQNSLNGTIFFKSAFPVLAPYHAKVSGKKMQTGIWEL